MSQTYKQEFNNLLAKLMNLKHAYDHAQQPDEGRQVTLKEDDWPEIYNYSPIHAATTRPCEPPKKICGFNITWIESKRVAPEIAFWEECRQTWLTQLRAVMHHPIYTREQKRQDVDSLVADMLTAYTRALRKKWTIMQYPIL